MNDECIQKNMRKYYQNNEKGRHLTDIWYISCENNRVCLKLLSKKNFKRSATRVGIP